MLQQTVSLVLDHEAHLAGRVGLAVVGLGSWGPDVLEVLGDSAEAEVRWICDVDTSRLAKYRRHHPDARVTSRLDRILADPGVDAVVLATPLDTHYELAMDALEAGKHVFVSTPLAPSDGLAADVLTAARERSRIVMCAHMFPYSAPVRAVKRMIETGTLGDIYSISSSRVNLGPDQPAASVIWDLGPHEFSILLYWLSELPTSVRVLGRETMSGDIGHVAFIAMNYSSGIVANLELSWLSPSKLCRTVVAGSERTVVYEDGGSEPVRLFDCRVSDQIFKPFGERHRTRQSGDIVLPKIASYEPLELQLSDFLKAIRSGDLMEDHAKMARNVVRIAEAAEESLRTGGAEVSPTGDDLGLAHRAGFAAV